MLSFLDSPQCITNVKILSWNLNSVCTKLEKSYVRQLLYEYDIISINKVKTPLTVILSG